MGGGAQKWLTGFLKVESAVISSPGGGCSVRSGAPGILRGEDFAYEADWWALGVLLYGLLLGTVPFPAADWGRAAASGVGIPCRAAGFV